MLISIFLQLSYVFTGFVKLLLHLFQFILMSGDSEWTIPQVHALQRKSFHLLHFLMLLQLLFTILDFFLLFFDLVC